jgi:hypothetical protein
MRELKTYSTSAAQRQRGVAAIAMSMLTVAVAGAVLGSFLLYRSQQAQSQAQEQRHAMSWAHQAVQAFVAIHGRLPCPAALRAGNEDCSSGAGKGWLPVSSLLASTGASGSPAPESMAMRYLVNRGAGGDLAMSGAIYQPVFPPGERPAAYPMDIAGTMDVCARLLSAADAEGMAYGIAVAAPGGSESASGTNADFAQPGFESPHKAVDLVYRDRVSLRTRGEVAEAARCSDVSASLDALAAATTWVDAALSIQQANVERGNINADINTLGAISDGFYLVDSMADLTNGVYNLVNNAVKKGIASSNPFLWPYVPVHAGGMSKALAGVALSAVDTARNAGTLAIRAGQVQAFRNMSRAAIDQPVWQGALGMLATAHEVGISSHLPPLTTSALGQP